MLSLHFIDGFRHAIIYLFIAFDISYFIFCFSLLPFSWLRHYAADAISFSMLRLFSDAWLITMPIFDFIFHFLLLLSISFIFAFAIFAILLLFSMPYAVDADYASAFAAYYFDTWTLRDIFIFMLRFLRFATLHFLHFDDAVTMPGLLPAWCLLHDAIVARRWYFHAMFRRWLFFFLHYAFADFFSIDFCWLHAYDAATAFFRHALIYFHSVADCVCLPAHTAQRYAALLPPLIFTLTFFSCQTPPHADCCRHYFRVFADYFERHWFSLIVVYAVLPDAIFLYYMPLLLAPMLFMLMLLMLIIFAAADCRFLISFIFFAADDFLRLLWCCRHAMRCRCWCWCRHTRCRLPPLPSFLSMSPDFCRFCSPLPPPFSQRHCFLIAAPFTRAFRDDVAYLPRCWCLADARRQLPVPCYAAMRCASARVKRAARHIW